jgi:hypothetical protein
MGSATGKCGQLHEVTTVRGSPRKALNFLDQVVRTSLTAGTANTQSVKAPRGKGLVPVVVTFNGGQRARTGTLNYLITARPRSQRDN